MNFFNILKTTKRIFTLIIVAFNVVMVTTPGARAAEDTKLICQAPMNTNALDLKSLGIILSSAIPVGTVVTEGVMKVDVKCALNFIDYTEGLSAEVYFKRLAIPEGSLGYGLTLYMGYGGEYSNEAGSVATGKMITTYGGITGGGTLNDYTEFTLSIPYRIVRTSSSLTPVARTSINLFQVGSIVTGRDETYLAINLRNNSVTVKDETCSVAGNPNQ